MTDISRSLQNNSTAQRNTQTYSDYLDQQEKGKNIDLRQKVFTKTKAVQEYLVIIPKYFICHDQFSKKKLVELKRYY